MAQTGNQSAARGVRPACPDQKIEVVVESDSGVERVALRCFTWTEGLGWCAQKTIRLEAEQLDELHRAITAARHGLARRRADAGLPHASAQIIQFPTVA